MRFRAYLLASFKNFEADVRDRAMALKRGGGLLRVTFDAGALEAHGRSLACDDNPERLYARQWAMTLFERARERVRVAYAKSGKATDFAVLGPYAMSKPESPTHLAGTLGLSEGAARVALHRLRRRFGAAVRAEVAATVCNPHQVESELRFLLSVMAGAGDAGSGHNVADDQP